MSYSCRRARCLHPLAMANERPCPKPGDQRGAEHGGIEGTHLAPSKLVRCFSHFVPRLVVSMRQLNGPVNDRSNLCPQGQLEGRLAPWNVGHVPADVGGRCGKVVTPLPPMIWWASHELERRVLRALDGNLTSYGVTALNLDDVQESSVTRRSGFRRLASGEGYTT